MFSHNEDYSHMPVFRVVPPHKDLVATKKKKKKKIHCLSDQNISFPSDANAVSSLMGNNAKVATV